MYHVDPAVLLNYLAGHPDEEKNDTIQKKLEKVMFVL